MWVEGVGSLHTCTLSCWKQRGAGFQPAGRLINRTVTRLRRIDAVDCSTVVWGAVLHAIRVVTAARLREGEPARPMTAVRVAQHRLRDAAREELWWVHKRNRWIRDGGRDTRRVPTTVADWARKWSGLFRPRDERACSSGFDARGWVVTTWPVRSDGRHGQCD